MKILQIIILTLFVFCSYGQVNGPLSTIDFVQILDDQKEETLFYYNNNWKKLRERAIKEEYILSYQFLEVEPTEEAPFHIMLVTTYINKEQYDKREDNFKVLIEKSGPTKLLNDNKPTEFRKVLFHKDPVKHIF